MNIEDLDLEVKTFNRLKKAGISTVDELLAEMYSPGSKVSQPDAKRCEEVLKAAGIIKYMRGDTVTEDDIEPEPLSWDELHSYIGKLVVCDKSTESHRWLKVCWIYDIQDEGEGNLIYNDGSSSYGYARRSSVNGDLARDFSPCLKYSEQFFALKTSEVPQEQSSDLIIESAEYTMAVALHRKICVSAELAEQNLFEMCKGLCEMRDKQLYRELGCQTFEEYCKKELKISDRQGRKYAAIASLLTADRKSTSGFEKLGTEKLYLLSRIEEDARIEIMEKNDLENTSVRELKAKITELEKEKGKLIDDIKRAGDEKAGYKERQDKLLQKNIELVGERDKAQQEADNASNKLKMIEADAQAHKAKIQELEKQIQELEAKPRDSYEDTTKIEELKKQLAEAEERHRADLRINSTEDIKGIFKAHMMAAVDALRHLTQFTEVHIDSPEKALFIEKLENVDMLINQTISKLKGV